MGEKDQVLLDAAAMLKKAASDVTIAADPSNKDRKKYIMSAMANCWAALARIDGALLQDEVVKR
jgi:hypothetical protein